MNTHQRTSPAGAVVVALGAQGFEAGLAFGAEEACLAHAPLHLAHVVHLSPAEAYAGVVTGAIETADAVLAEAREQAEKLVEGQVPVTVQRLDEGWLVHDLGTGFPEARLVVLEHRRQSRARRLVTGSIVAGVASRSSVPVVSVPEDWRPSRSVPDVVTVGVQHPEEAEALIRRGVAEARVRGADVIVANAWYIGGGYDSVVADPDFRAQEERKVHEAIAPILLSVRDASPDVSVGLSVLHSPAMPALVQSSAQSRLLVVGRRHHRLPVGSHLGPVARGVLMHALCPVLVEPELPGGSPPETPGGVRSAHERQGAPA